MSKTFSGAQVVKILCKEFGFSVLSQNGSHAKLRKYCNNRKITTVVPMHKELSKGTFKDALEFGEVSESDGMSKR